MTKWQSTSLNENLIKRPDLLDSLVGVLHWFRQSKFCFMANIQEDVSPSNGEPKGQRCSGIHLRSSTDEIFQDIQMNFHLFEKVDLLCCCIWALNKTASDNIVKIANFAKESQIIFTWMIV